jgi:hypothetical protein
MAFVIDGSEWQFDGWTEHDIILVLELLLARVDAARVRQEIVWIGQDLQSKVVRNDQDFWTMLSQPEFHAFGEVTQELAAWLGRASFYEDDAEWPVGLDQTDIQIDNEPPVDNPDVAWAHHWMRSSKAVACLGLRRSGVHSTKSNLGQAEVHWVCTEAGHRQFWRSAIDIEHDNENTLIRLAPHAYPDLYFSRDVWRGLSRFAGGYQAVRVNLREYLAVLDDDGAWAFTAAPPVLSRLEPEAVDQTIRPSNQVIERRFIGLGLTMAPENPNVYAERACREAREILVAGRTLYCEWHGKLEPHQNRIHVHPPVAESNGKVVIGVFRDHLPLP